MPSPLLAFVSLALLVPPPPPLPPPERMAAVADLRRIAPFSDAARNAALETAVLKAAGRALGDAAKQADYYEMLPLAQDRIRQRLAGIRPEVEGRVGGCLDEHLGNAFDLEALQDMGRFVATKGGRALWERATAEPAQFCYDTAVSDLLRGFGFAGAITWLAEHKLLARVPPYAAVGRKQPDFARALETLCGKSARGVLESRQGVLGMKLAWLDNDVRRNGYTSFCLLQAAKVAGQDLRVFDTEKPPTGL